MNYSFYDFAYLHKSAYYPSVKTDSFKKDNPVPAHATFYRNTKYNASRFINGFQYVNYTDGAPLNKNAQKLAEHVLSELDKAVEDGVIKVFRKRQQLLSVIACIFSDVYINSCADMATLIPYTECHIARRFLGRGRDTTIAVVKRIDKAMPGILEYIPGNWHKSPALRTISSVTLTEKGFELARSYGLDTVFGDIRSHIEYKLHSSIQDEIKANIKSSLYAIDDQTRMIRNTNDLSEEDCIAVTESCFDKIKEHQELLVKYYAQLEELDLSATKDDVIDSKALETVNKIEFINEVRNTKIKPIKLYNDGKELAVSTSLKWHIRINKECDIVDQHKYLYARGYSPFGSMPEAVRLSSGYVGIDMKSSSGNHIRMAKGLKPVKCVYSEHVTADITRALVKKLYMAAVNTKSLRSAYVTAMEMTYSEGIDYKAVKDDVKSIVKYFFDNYRVSEDFSWASSSTIESMFNIGIHYEFAKRGQTIESVHDQWYVKENQLDLFEKVVKKVAFELYGLTDTELWMSKSQLENGEIVEHDFCVKL